MNFQSLEVVCRGSETQLQVTENLNWITQCSKGSSSRTQCLCRLPAIDNRSVTILETSTLNSNCSMTSPTRCSNPHPLEEHRTWQPFGQGLIAPIIHLLCPTTVATAGGRYSQCLAENSQYRGCHAWVILSQCELIDPWRFLNTTFCIPKKLNPYSARIDSSRQNLKSVDFRFRRLKSIPAL